MRAFLAPLVGLAAVIVTAPAGSALAQGQPPKPLGGSALNEPTGLRLLVADRPPFVLAADSGEVEAVSGLKMRSNAVISVQRVGDDAVVLVANRQPGRRMPSAQAYVVRAGTRVAIRLGHAHAAAPGADGESVWVLRSIERNRCTLSEMGLDGLVRHGPKPMRCFSQLREGGTAGIVALGPNRMFLIEPVTGRTLLRARQVLAVAGQRVLTSNGPSRPLTLTDLRDRTRIQIRWPSELQYTAEAVVDPGSDRMALGFADPSYEGTGQQVMDIWLLDASTGRIEHLPDMPADVALKSTSISWASDSRLVMLAQSGERDLVAVWRPGDERIAVRPVKLPVRNSGSDTFVAWPSGWQR